MPEVRDCLNEIVAECQSNNAIVIAGAGLTIAATKNNSLRWDALIRSLLEAYKQQRSYDQNICERAAQSIEAGNLVEAAEKIKAHLSEAAFSAWLTESFANLDIVDESLIKSIGRLSIPIATTNYDTVIEAALGRRDLRFKEGFPFARWLNGTDRSILHLHGVWEDSHTIILTSRDYSGDYETPFALSVYSQMQTKTWIWIGVGAGFSDPSFTRIRMLRDRFNLNVGKHYLFANEHSCEKLREEHQADDSICVVPYGDKSGRLQDHLEYIATHCAPSPRPDPHWSLTQSEVQNALKNYFRPGNWVPAHLIPFFENGGGNDRDKDWNTNGFHAYLIESTGQKAAPCGRVIVQGPMGIGKSVLVQRYYASSLSGSAEQKAFIDGGRIFSTLTTNGAAEGGARASGVSSPQGEDDGLREFLAKFEDLLSWLIAHSPNERLVIVIDGFDVACRRAFRNRRQEMSDWVDSFYRGIDEAIAKHSLNDKLLLLLTVDKVGDDTLEPVSKPS